MPSPIFQITKILMARYYPHLFDYDYGEKMKQKQCPNCKKILKKEERRRNKDEIF